ncbi:MAG: stage 0 sporulation family protein [Desulfuromonadaceae bacterium]|nr:stage 0 sporulation family protein [Desulfuromonadaceae bacterium]
MPHIVTIQFTKAGKMFDFNAGSLELAQGDHVVVETERGVGIGQIVKPPVEREGGTTASLAFVKRKATAEDMATLESISRKEQEAYRFCVNRIIERNMPMKLVRVEYQFDSSKAVFFFTADGRVDFRDLVKDLAHSFHTRIEMRQIGVRDEAKMTGGIGICGRELCCSSFLRDFQPVSVKMAKEQNLALNPNKISGQCGRLLCCLDYEYETYCCLRKNFPKSGKRVRTVNAVGVVDKINILTGNITLKLDDNKIIVIKRDEIIGDGAPAAAPAVAAAPAPRSPQRTRERRPEPRRKQEKTSLESYNTKAESAAKAAPAPPAQSESAAPSTPPESAKSGQPRKKHRSRKHGHRKQSGAAPDSGTPTPSSGA